MRIFFFFLSKWIKIFRVIVVFNNPEYWERWLCACLCIGSFNGAKGCTNDDVNNDNDGDASFVELNTLNVVETANAYNFRCFWENVCSQLKDIRS